MSSLRSHFQFGNGWFPVHKTQVVYKGQGLFHVDCETSSNICEVRVKPEQVEAVKQYLTEVLVEGEESDWVPESWDPEPEANAKADAKAAKPLANIMPVGTQVCTLEEQGWFFGHISVIEQDRKVYRVSYARWSSKIFAVDSKQIIPCNVAQASLHPGIQFLCFNPEKSKDSPMLLKTVTRLIPDECVLCSDNSYVLLSEIQAVLPVE